MKVSGGPASRRMAAGGEMSERSKRAPKATSKLRKYFLIGIPKMAETPVFHGFARTFGKPGRSAGFAGQSF